MMRRYAFALWVLALAAGTARAGSQDQALLFSTSSAAGLASGRTADDGEVCLKEAASTSRIYFNEQGLEAVLGGVPTDIDGLHYFGAPPATATYMNVAFSLVSDQFGFKDGDILFVDSQGRLDVAVEEETIAASLGLSGQSIDVDGFAFGPQGELYFSLEANVGTVLDGDIHVLQPTSSTATLLYSEAQILAFVQNALGTGLTTIGDTIGVAIDPQTSDILFVVQTPSEIDGTVFSSAGGGSLVPGFAEADHGFTTAAELDAITLVPAGRPMPTLEASDTRPAEGATLTITADHGTPGRPFVILAANSPGFELQPNPFQGTGVLLLDRQDPLFQFVWGNVRLFIGSYDASGARSFPVVAPATGGVIVTYRIQVVDLATLAWSNAVDVDVNG